MTDKILLTGASGYVGGRLLGRFLAQNLPVRCLSRKPEFLKASVGDDVEVVTGDVLDRDSLSSALREIDTAYYLVHSMGSAGDFEEEDRRAAQNFAEAAKAAGVRRIIYLGGLGNDDDPLSQHLRSRHEVGKLLGVTGVQVIELRASIVIGSGSLSFEMIRALVEKLPVMITPRWVSVPAQPIAIEDLLDYLVAVRDLPGNDSHIFEIGGPEPVSYGELMREYARQRGLRRWLIRVPVLTPRLSSLWLGLVTPLYARIGRKLIDSIKYPTLVRDSSALDAFALRPKGYREAISAALRNEDRDFAETRWSDAVSSSGASETWTGKRLGNRLVDSRVATSSLSPRQAFAPIRKIGGANGWFFADGLWKLRGLIDLLFSGVGMRRGRRDATQLRVGDAIDWWRVEAFEPDRRLLLAAEMRLPGRAWLEFEVTPADRGSEIRQTAIFDPAGLAGLAYWYIVYPVHQLVFAGMLRELVRAGYSFESPKEPWKPSRARQAIWLVAFVAVCFAAAGIGGALTSTSLSGWYQSLAKPSWNPPDWIFGPVWSTLYFLMAVAAWLVWRAAGWRKARASMTIFAVQLALNVAWSGIFFALRSPGLAFAELVLLWLAIVTTIISFWGISASAALLLTPYLAWTTFAGLLNFTIWRMNA